MCLRIPQPHDAERRRALEHDATADFARGEAVADVMFDHSGKWFTSNVEPFEPGATTDPQSPNVHR